MGAARSPTSTRCASACPACTATTPRSRRCRRPTCSITLGCALRRPRHRQGPEAFAPERQGHPRRHRPRRARQGAPAPTCRSSATCKHRHRRADQGGEGRAGQARRARPRRRGSTTLRGLAGDATRSSTTQEEGGPLKPQFVIETLRDNTPDDCILVAGVGQHQMWASQLWKFKLAEHVGELGRARHDGLRGAGRGRRQGRPPRPHGVGDRRRRLLPDDRAGARHRERRNASR